MDYTFKTLGFDPARNIFPDGAAAYEEMIEDGELEMPVEHDIKGCQPEPAIKKQLRFAETFGRFVEEILPQKKAEETFIVFCLWKDGRLTACAWEPGRGQLKVSMFKDAVPEKDLPFILPAFAKDFAGSEAKVGIFYEDDNSSSCTMVRCVRNAPGSEIKRYLAEAFGKHVIN